MRYLGRLPIFCTIIPLLVYVGCLGCRRGDSRAGMNADVLFIVASLDKLAFEEPELFRDFVLRKPHTIMDNGLYQAATNALPRGVGYKGEDYNRFPTGLDPWGRPFHIDMRLVGTEIDQVGRRIQVFEVKLWSTGPDGKDQEGKGDDSAFGPFKVKVG